MVEVLEARRKPGFGMAVLALLLLLAPAAVQAAETLSPAALAGVWSGWVRCGREKYYLTFRFAEPPGEAFAFQFAQGPQAQGSCRVVPEGKDRYRAELQAKLVRFGRTVYETPLTLSFKFSARSVRVETPRGSPVRIQGTWTASGPDKLVVSLRGEGPSPEGRGRLSGSCLGPLPRTSGWDAVPATNVGVPAVR